MKQATQFALYGTIAIIAERMSYLISNFFNLEIFEQKIYVFLNLIEIIGFIAIANFFYVLYQKQNHKTNNNE